MKLLLFAVAPVSFLQACSSVTPLGPSKYPSVAVEHVDVLYQEPKRPYEVIALESYEAATRFSSVRDVVEKCRVLAAEAGADALIITSTYDRSFNAAARASAKAVRWKR